MVIKDGTGTGKELGINGRNEAKVFAVSESEAQAANDLGNAYNINTGEITGLTAGDATMLYFKNDEEETFVIEAIAVGLRGFTGLTNVAQIYITKNPTGGDLITDETAVTMNENRNFGSAKTLSSGSKVYKGKAAGTITGGSDVALLYAKNNDRGYFPINLEIPRGSSIAVRVESDATAGTCYAALIAHKYDSAR